MAEFRVIKIKNTLRTVEIVTARISYSRPSLGHQQEIRTNATSKVSTIFGDYIYKIAKHNHELFGK